MLYSFHIYLQIDSKYITPKFIFRLNNMLRNVFDNINDSSITYEIIQKFNNQLLNVEYADLK